MSLRKTPELTPELWDAARSNAQHSTGARSPAGKQHAKFNALKHGERSQPAHHYQVMRALGEDPEEFEARKLELRESFGAGDALYEKQIDDLARLYWRRERVERAETGLMRRALLAVEERQYQRQLEKEGVTFADPALLDSSMPWPDDPGLRLRQLHSYLQVVRTQVGQRLYNAQQGSELKPYYQENTGWRPARLLYLLEQFYESVRPRDDVDRLLDKSDREQGIVRELPSESEYQELVRLLEEEMGSVEKQCEAAEKRNEELEALERDACLAPAGEEWKMLLRREETLDRSIDRKIRILLSLRKEGEKKARAPAADPPAEGAPVEGGETEASSADLHLRSAVRPGRVTKAADRGEQVGATVLVGARPSHDSEAASSTAAGEGGSSGAASQGKIDERTGNVIENKEPAQNEVESRPAEITAEASRLHEVAGPEGVFRG